MTAINGSSPSSSADGVAWDLSDLYSGVDDPKLDSDLDSADVRAGEFAARMRIGRRISVMPFSSFRGGAIPCLAALP